MDNISDHLNDNSNQISSPGEDSVMSEIPLKIVNHNVEGDAALRTIQDDDSHESVSLLLSVDDNVIKGSIC